MLFKLRISVCLVFICVMACSYGKVIASPTAMTYTVAEQNTSEFVPSKAQANFCIANTPLANRQRLLHNASGRLGTSIILGQMGDSSVAIPMRAFVYRNQQYTDLGALPGGFLSESRAINNKGQIVGWSAVSYDNSCTHAFLYADGKLTDLNACIPAKSGWTLVSAEAINDYGQIIGHGIFYGESSNFLLTPTNLTSDEAAKLHEQIKEKKQALEEMRRPKSSLDRLGPLAAKIVQGAGRVETFRVELAKEKEPSTQAKIEGTDVIATGPVLDKQAANQITAVLLDKKPYLVISQPACLMMPAVIFRVWQGKSFVNIVICFHCGQMIIRGYNDSGSRVSDMYGLMTAAETHTFSALAKQAFPQDTIIQALPQ